jgi:predicted nucleic acid-binding protein
MYVDTSVVAKLYTSEPGSTECEATVSGHTLVSSSLLLCEFRSALLSKVSRGLVSPALEREIWLEFRKDITASKLTLLPMDDSLVHDAAGLLSEIYHSVPLRTLDALHLASYFRVEAEVFFTRDARLHRAARLLGADLPI